jgi:16S rRNA (uracil1498-N3)-methyltransferase
MARRLFFVDRISQDEAELHGEDAHHLTRVLRVRVGEQMEISDNLQVALAEVIEAGKSHVRFRVIERRGAQALPANLHLVPALFKFDHFEWMIEKAVELGVTRICPMLAEFSGGGLEAACAKRRQRWLRLIKEASQQCRRWRLPVLEEAAPLARQLEREGFRLFLDEHPGGAPILAALADWNPNQPANLMVGPEGGWAPHERAAAEQAGWRRVTLGPTILRAETAGIAALAALAQYCHAQGKCGEVRASHRGESHRDPSNGGPQRP